MVGQAGCLILIAGVREQILFLAFQSSQAALRLAAAPLKLGQRDNAAQVGLSQPLDLLD